MMTRVDSPFLPNDSTRVTISDSKLDTESFLQNLQTSDWQTQFICTQRIELFCFIDDQHWRKFSVLTVYPGSIMIHFMYQVFYLIRKKSWDNVFHWGASRTLNTLSWFNVIVAYCDHGRRPISSKIVSIAMKNSKIVSTAQFRLIDRNWEFICRQTTHVAHEPDSLFWCHAVMSCVHSFPGKSRLRNLRADCSTTVGLYCVTIPWQQIFKGLLQVTVVP